MFFLFFFLLTISSSISCQAVSSTRRSAWGKFYLFIGPLIKSVNVHVTELAHTKKTICVIDSWKVNPPRGKPTAGSKPRGDAKLGGWLKILLPWMFWLNNDMDCSISLFVLISTSRKSRQVPFAPPGAYLGLRALGRAATPSVWKYKKIKHKYRNIVTRIPNTRNVNYHLHIFDNPVLNLSKVNFPGWWIIVDSIWNLIPCLGGGRGEAWTCWTWTRYRHRPGKVQDLYVPW